MKWYGVLACMLALTSCGGGAPGVAPGSSAAAPGVAPGSSTAAPGVAPAASAKPAGSAAAAATSGAGNAAAKAGSPNIKIAYSSLTAMGLPFEVATDTGIFTRNGLTGEPIYTAGSPNAIKAVIAGDIQFASVGSSASIQANLNGAKLVLVATGSPGMSFRIYARPEIKSIADLKGKRIVESQIGSDPDFALQLALPRNGLAYSDVQMMHIEGNNPAQLAAYKSSGAEAVILSAGAFAQAERDFGAHLLLDIGAMKIPYNQAAMAGSRDWVNSHKDETQRFVRSYAEGLKSITQNREQAIAVMKKYSKNDDQGVADEAYDYYVQVAGGRLPSTTEEGVQSLIDLVAQTTPAVKQHKPSEYIDNSFVQQLATEGFSPK